MTEPFNLESLEALLADKAYPGRADSYMREHADEIMERLRALPPGVMVLGAEDFDDMVNVLASPSSPTEAMLEAAALHAKLVTPIAGREFAHTLMRDAWGALNFILAFYEPGQRYLDTNAWKQAEAGGRAVHARLRAYLDNLDPTEPTP